MAYKKENKNRITVRLSEIEIDKLNQLQSELQLSKSHVIRMLIEVIHGRFERAKV